jgi:hypothetical protein
MERIYKPTTTLSDFWKGFHICCYDRGHADRELYVGFTEFYRAAEIHQKL